MLTETTISEIRVKNKGELNPILVEFLNGVVPEDKMSTLEVKLKPYESLKEKVVEICTPDDQKYYNNPIYGLLLDNKYIAIRNKKTNKMRLVEIGITPLINSLYFKKVEMKIDSRDSKEQMATLQRLFGTKKAVRQLEQKEALDIDRSHIEGQINELLADTSTADTSTLNESLNRSNTYVEEECLSSLIPPCHRDAVDIFNIYKIEDCISKDEIASLGDGVQQILSNEKNLEKSVFLETFLPQAVSKTEDIKIRLACLLYAEALTTYLRAPARNLAKLSQTLCPHSKLIGEKIIREFSVKTGHSLNRPLSMKDKAVCYVIVLILIACNYRIDLEALAKISGFGYRKLRQLGRIIGVLPADKTSGIHVLRLPLPPPVKMVKTSRYNNKR